MSTIRAKSPNSQDTKYFQTAIAEAVRQEKILFCALRESEEALIAEDFYPVGLEQVFKIGSATRTGNQDSIHSGDGKSVQFILSGLEVRLENEGEIRTLGGSSVATALAARLAALVLFCADLVDQDSVTMGQHHIEERGQSLLNIAKMKKVFVTMSREINKGRFPEVQKYIKIAGRDPHIEDIKTLINSLMSAFRYLTLIYTSSRDSIIMADDTAQCSSTYWHFDWSRGIHVPVVSEPVSVSHQAYR
ncbi:hypothetical protein BJX99DRAFT_261482 [Aspergillus californicus]